MTSKAKTPHRQNRIDYIVFHDPDAVRALIEEFGYEVPLSAHELVEVTKEVIRQEGRPFIFELLRLHPDAAALEAQLREQLAQDQELNYCGACGHANLNFDGEDYPEALPATPLVEMTDHELREYYESLRSEADQWPEDPTLSRQMELVWNALRKRTVPDDRDEDPDDEPGDGFELNGITLLLTIGFAFTIGLVIGKL